MAVQTEIIGRMTTITEGGRRGTLILADGTTFEGTSFGAPQSIAGEVVFCTGMVGYPEAITDASYSGQLLVMTYPLIGNYGVPEPSLWEDKRIRVSGLIVSDYIDTPFHAQSAMTLAQWLQDENIPALVIKDTRQLTQHIRAHGTMPAKICFDDDIPFHEPDKENLVAQVSVQEVRTEGNGQKTIVMIDCGAKRNINRCLLQRDVTLIVVPWDYDLFAPENAMHFDGILISNGPGNPKMVPETIATIRKAMAANIPILGICLGHQLLALAAGGDTYKLPYGHRSQNQPCIQHGTKRCYITTQNHGFTVGTIPPDFEPWFINANDGSNEGIRHRSKPFMSVQFHPEAAPGPTDSEWIFDHFLEMVTCKS